MVKGFNSDIHFRGRRYHIQTEDWGHENPFIVTRVFCDGAVLKTFKIGHEDAIRPGHSPEKVVRDQHHRIMDLVMAGDLVRI